MFGRSYSLETNHGVTVQLPLTFQPISHLRRRPGQLAIQCHSQATGQGRAATLPVLDDSKLPKLKLTETLLLQGFGWESWKGSGGKSWWAALKDKVPAMKAAGFTHVWLPPPSQSVSAQGYLPGQLYNLNSKYGSRDELIDLNRALLDAGIRPVADIVINHRSADEKDDEGRWTRYRDDVDHRGKRIDWGKWAITSNDPDYHGTGQPDTGDDYGPAPDLDHTNKELRDSLVDWMGCYLRDWIGFRGWRFDFVRGYAPKYTAEYVERTLGTEAWCVGEYFVDLRWSGAHLEYNQDQALHTLCGWLQQAKYCALFDFPAKGAVQEAIKHTEYDRLRGSQGRGPGLMGVNPTKAVTFVDNHDTGSTQQHWPWPRDHVMLGYALILTHPGSPCVFYEHMFNWGLEDEISQLVAVRKRNGIVADSKLEILEANKDIYVGKVADRVVVKLGPRYDMGQLLPDSKAWIMVASGQDYAVWERKQQ